MPERFVPELPQNEANQTEQTREQTFHHLVQAMAQGVILRHQARRQRQIERLSIDPTVDDGDIIFRGLE